MKGLNIRYTTLFHKVLISDRWSHIELDIKLLKLCFLVTTMKIHVRAHFVSLVYQIPSVLFVWLI